MAIVGMNQREKGAVNQFGFFETETDRPRRVHNLQRTIESR